jgi:methylase of polypeptide subunit release factors
VADRHDGPLGLGDPHVVGALGRLLRERGYDGPTLRRATGARGDVVTPSPTDLPVVLRKLDAEPALGVLIRLLLLNLRLPGAEVREALAPVDVERLAGVGLLRRPDGEVEASVRLVPHEKLVYVCDRVEAERSGGDPEYVAPLNPSSLSLDMLTVRRPVASLLDVGTGPGFQALQAAEYVDRVVATDLNPRALNYAAFAAQLNGIENVDLRFGNLYEPVAGERFEQVLCNPPYIISPDSEFLYRDSGREADALCREIVQGAPAHLEEGAIAQILVSWVMGAEEDWAAPLRRWVEGSGCDALLLHFKTDSPVDTAAMQQPIVFSEDPDYIAVTLDRWLAYYERIGASAIGYGAVVLRRRAGGSNWVQALTMTRAGAAGEHVLRLIEAQDVLDNLSSPDEVLDERLVLAPLHTLVQRYESQRGAWALVKAELALDDGIGFQGSVDAPTVRLLPLLDGRRTVRDALGRVAEEAGMGDPPEHRAAFIAAGIPMVTRLLSLGFLVPAPPRPGA